MSDEKHPPATVEMHLRMPPEAEVLANRHVAEHQRLRAIDPLLGEAYYQTHRRAMGFAREHREVMAQVERDEAQADARAQPAAPEDAAALAEYQRRQALDPLLGAVFEQTNRDAIRRAQAAAPPKETP